MHIQVEISRDNSRSHEVQSKVWDLLRLTHLHKVLHNGTVAAWLETCIYIYI